MNANPKSNIPKGLSLPKCQYPAGPEPEDTQAAERPIFLAVLPRALQALSLYGAAAILCLGWTLDRLLDLPPGPYAPLWFAGALFVYSIDRLKRDPADAINIPRRQEESLRLRPLTTAIAALAGIALIIIPLVRRDWLSLSLTIAAAIVCANYSVPLLGFRFKDIPLLKTLFAPALVAAAYFVLPILRHGPPGVAYTLLVVAWTGCFLLFNMTICDLRDIEGDTATGARSLPVMLGPPRSLHFLRWLLAVLFAAGVAAALAAPPPYRPAWMLITLCSTGYLTVLLRALRIPRPESFYEWWVEGMFFVPPITLVACKFFKS